MSGAILGAVRREPDGVLVQQVRDGDATAFAELFERWYDRVYDVARNIVRRPELAADVAQDALVAAWQQVDRLDDVNAFGGWLLRITRHKALDALRRETRATATDTEIVGALGDQGAPNPAGTVATGDPVTAAEAADTAALVWAAAAALGPRDASLLDLHLRHGLTPAELAVDLEVEPNHAHQLVFRLRKRLEDAIGSFLLWRGGRPACVALAAATGPTTAFDERTAGIIRRHERGCEACRGERGERTRPAALFAATPIVAAPLVFRTRAAHALAAEGVPVRTKPAALEPAPSPSATDAAEPPAADARSSARTRGALAAVAVVVAVVSLLVADAVRAPDLATVAGPSAASTAARLGVAPPTATTRLSATTSMRPATTSPAAATTLPPTTSTSTSTPATTTTAATTGATATGATATSTSPTTVPTGATTTPASTTVETTPDTTGVPDPPTTVAPPRTAPPVVVAEPVSPPTSPPSPTEPTARPRPPSIVRFVLLAGDHECAPGSLARRAGWVTEGATSVSLRWPSGTDTVGPTGERPLCLGRGDAVTITASSATGSVSETASAR